MFRCYLTLGQTEKAALARQSLVKTPQDLQARLLAIESNIALGKALQAGQQLAAARSALQTARVELDTARRVRPDDPRLVWAEAQLVQNETGDAGKASTIVLEYARNPKINYLNGRLVYLSWLLNRGSLAEADELLTAMENGRWRMENGEWRMDAEVRSSILHPPSSILALGLLRYLRARLILAQRERRFDQARPLLDVLRGQDREMGSDVLDALEMLGPGRETASGEQALYFQGGLAAQGDFQQAVQCYARLLSFPRYKASVRAGLLISLLELATGEGPEAANRLAYEMLQKRPNDPALLLAFAETAIPLNRVHGELRFDKSYDDQEQREMAGALLKLEIVLREQVQSPAVGAYYKAWAWNTAGRPDLARREANRANRQYQPALLLAGRLALADGDWQACLEYGHELQQTPATDAVKPGFWEAWYWRGKAFEGLNRTEEAWKTYFELLSKFPDRPEGYLGMAGILEKRKDYANALAWLAALAGTPARRPRRFGSTNPAAGSERPARAGGPIGRLVADNFPIAQRESRCRPGSCLHSRYPVCRAARTRGRVRGAALKLAENVPAGQHRQWVAGLQTLLGEIYMHRLNESQAVPQRADYLNKAIAAFNAVRSADPRNFQAGVYLARLLVQERSQADAACAVLDESLKGPYGQRPMTGDRLTLDTIELIGKCYCGTRQFETAGFIFEKAPERYGEEPLIFLYLGRCLTGVGKYREADSCFDKAVRMAEKKATNAPAAERKQWLGLAERGTRREETAQTKVLRSVPHDRKHIPISDPDGLALVAVRVVVGSDCSCLWMAGSVLRWRARPQPQQNPVMDFFQEWASAKNYFNGLPVYARHGETLERYLGEGWKVPDRLGVRINAHPPTSVLLGLPLASLSYWDAFLIWSLLSLAALTASFWLMIRQLGIAFSPWLLLPLVTILLLCGPFRQHMNQGQLGIILLLLITASWAASRSGWLLWAGVFLGAATALKLFPGFLFLYFVLWRQWRTVGAGIVTVAVLTALTAAIFGVDTYHSYVRDALPEAARFRNGWNNASLLGFWSKLFDEGAGQVVPLWYSPWLAWAGTLTCSAAVAALTARAIWRVRSQAECGTAFGLCVIAMLLLSPVTWEHYFVLLFLPAIILWARLRPWSHDWWMFAGIVTLLWLPPMAYWHLFMGATQANLTTLTATPRDALTGLAIPCYALVALFIFALAECGRRRTSLEFGGACSITSINGK